MQHQYNVHSTLVQCTFLTLKGVRWEKMYHYYSVTLHQDSVKLKLQPMVLFLSVLVFTSYTLSVGIVTL